MKKLAIAGASMALAAMPVIGVFADTNVAITDQIQVTVQDSCAMTAAASGGQAGDTGGTYSATVPVGTLITPDSGEGNVNWGNTSVAKTYTFSCNNVGGWQVSAQGMSGTSTEATTQTSMVGNTAGSDAIATGTATSGATSNWAFKITPSENASSLVQSTYSNWSAVPGSSNNVIIKSDNNNKPISNATFTPSYRVWVSTTQDADTYNGYVKYVLTAPIPSV